MKHILVTLFLTTLCIYSVHLMTEAQMKSTAKIMRNVCQPKTKVTNEQIENMHKGDFEDDQRPKCYMNCVLQMMKVMKNGKFDYNSAQAQLPSLPPRYQGPTKESLEKCKDEANDADACEASYALTKCIYFAAPEFYFLP